MVVQDENKRDEIDCECDIEIAKVTGALDTVAANIRSLSEQLKEKQFKKVDTEHREKLIEHKTVQMAAADLQVGLF